MSNKPTAKQLISQQEQDKIAEFYKEYHDLTKKYGYAHVAVFNVTQDSLSAVLRLAPLKGGEKKMQDEGQTSTPPVESQEQSVPTEAQPATEAATPAAEEAA